MWVGWCVNVGRCTACDYHTSGDHCNVCYPGYVGHALSRSCSKSCLRSHSIQVLSSRKGRAVATSLNFCVSHGSATRFIRNSEKCYIYFIDNLLLFPKVKEFSKWVNSWWSYHKKFDTMFFLRHSVYLFCTPLGSENFTNSVRWLGNGARCVH